MTCKCDFCPWTNPSSFLALVFSELDNSLIFNDDRDTSAGRDRGDEGAILTPFFYLDFNYKALR
jgi:hypothetical protein